MTIKDDVLNFIKEETHKSIQEKRFDFENCNASFVSQIIYQDRTNVSRILNNLFREGTLIKKTGRPTVFISKEELNKEFPFAHFPNVIDKTVHIEKYINSNIGKRKESFSQSFHIIGSSQNGSLHNAINQLMSIFFYPDNLLKVIFLSGEDGSGKKYIIQEVFKRFLNLGMIESDQQITFLDYWQFHTDLVNQLKTTNKNVIVIQLTQDVNIVKIKEIINRFEVEYFNEHIKPILCFLYPNNEELNEISDITPLYIEIPPFIARPVVEQLDLTISFLKKESERLQKRITVSKHFIEALINTSKNIHILQHNISYIVSRYFFYIQGNEQEILLDYDLITNYLPHLEKKDERINLQNISNIFTIESSQKEIVVSEPNEKKSHQEIKKQYITKWVPNATQWYLYYLENMTSETNYREIIKGKMYNIINKALEKKMPYYDVFTKNKIINIILNIALNTGDFSQLFFNLPSISGLNSQVISISENIEKKLIEINQKLSTKQSYWIRNFLSHSFFTLSEYTIPIVLISKNNLLIQSMQTVFNVNYQKNILYTYNINENNLNKDLESLSNFIISIDRGKGVLLLTDKSVRSKIASHFYSNTKVSTHTISYSTFPLILECIKEFKNSNKNLLPHIPELVMINSKIEKMLNKEKFNTYSTRATNEYMLSLKNLFPNINTYEMNEAIFTLLKNLTEALEIPLCNQLIMDFIFYMNTLMSFKKLNYNLIFIQEAYCLDERFEMIIRQFISKNDKIKKYNFSSGDIEYIRQIISYFS